MVALECHIGMASRTIEIPAGFKGTTTFLKRHFSTGSKGIIKLSPVSHVDDPALVGDEVSEVDALDLHLAAASLTGNIPGQRPISRIALVLADRYRFNPNVFGLMFDRGMPTEDDPNDSPLIIGTPREACAIFLGAIQELRPNRADYDREVEFTAIHELGHVFNLGHHDNAANFMARSRVAQPHDDNYFTFLENQRNWLADCTANPLVHPGGSIFDPASGLNEAQREYLCRGQQLSLRIGTASSEFPCSSPVELDVSLSVTGSGSTRHFVPDRLDPGYEQFRIWITHPNGERRLFRSPRQYCALPSRVLVTRKLPRRRDISLFDSATGKTFVKPGMYELQAEFNLGARGWIRSNRLIVQALDDHLCLDPGRLKLLRDRRVRAFLYHRSMKAGRNTARVLAKHLKQAPAGAGANDIRYALVRAATTDIKQMSKPTMRFVSEQIHRIEDNEKGLGKRQIHHIYELSRRYAEES